MTAALSAILAAALSLGQAPSAGIRGVVVDVSGAAIPNAQVTVVTNGAETTVTADQNGRFTVAAGTDALRVVAPGYAPADVAVRSATTVRVVLRPPSFAESVTVTAARGADRLPGAGSATVLTGAELANAPAGALDDVLRQTPGFSLFRRSSSRVANPTTQGVTLRGVSGSGASRTLVLADGVPLNDPFGSWVYWNRVPLAAVDRVEVVRGAAGDLYGADALGGVVQVLTLNPDRPQVRATVEGGSHGTARASAFGGFARRGAFVSAAGEWLGTDGVVTMAPESAGPIDVPADSDYQTGFVAAGISRGSWRALGRFSAYGEDRSNGTPAQVNDTTWTQIAGEVGGLVARGAWEARVSGGTQEYFQTFSAVAADRRSERLTTEQTTPSDFFAASGQWTTALGRHALLVGADTTRTDSTLEQFSTSFAGVRTGPFFLGGIERTSAVFARASLVASDRVTVGLGARGDFWDSEPLDTTLPDQSQSFFSPRAAVTWRASDVVSVQGAAYRAHRTPTLNELHRGFRVGNVITNANPLLEPETLDGVEGGVLVTRRGWSARATAFTHRLDGAIANVTLDVGRTLITRQRQNSDEIRATGLELEADLRLGPTLSVNGQLTWTASHFRGSVAQPDLEDNRVPQVPRVQAAATVTWADPRLLTATVQIRGASHQFDDDQNELPLDGFAVVDAQVSRHFVQGLTGFVSVENLFDAEYDVGRTPLRTIGWPRTVRAGVRIALP